MLDFVEKLVGAGEFARRADVGAYRHRGYFVRRRLVVDTGYLDILEAVINEDRVPFFGLVALFDVFVRLEAVRARHSAHLHIELAVFKEHIGVADRDLGVFRAAECVRAKARHILLEFDDVAVFRFSYHFRRKGFLNADRRHFHRLERTAGALHYLCAVPRAVVVVWIFVFAELCARVVMLAVADAIEEDRAFRAAPRRVGNDLFDRAVGIGDLQLAYHFRPVTPRCRFGVPRVLGKTVIPSVAEHDGNDVFPRCEFVAHVVSQVHIVFREIGESGREHVVACVCTVDPALVVTESAY